MRTPPPAPDARPRRRCARSSRACATRGSRQELLGTYLVDMNAMFFGMPLALFPAIAERYGGAGVLGLMFAAPAAGAVVAALASGWTRTCTATGARSRSRRRGGAWRSSASVRGRAVARARLPRGRGRRWTRSRGLFRSVIWNATIPDRLRGRLAGVEMLSYTSGPTLGNAEAGASPRSRAAGGGRLGRRPVRRRDRRPGRAAAALLDLRRPPARRGPAAARVRPRAHAAVIRTRRACAQCSTVRNARRSRRASDV